MDLLGIGSALSGIAQSAASVYNTNKTIKSERELAEFGYNKDLEMWNRQNLYNAPSQQMQRFKEAGLNPNLIYGKGNPGNATVLPKYNVPQAKYNYQPPDLGAIMQVLQGVRKSDAEIRLINQQRRESSARERNLDNTMWKDMALIWGDTYSDGRKVEYRGAKHDYARKLVGESPFYQKYMADLQRVNILNSLYSKQTQLRDLDIDWYMFDKFARPVGDMLKLVPGLRGALQRGSKFKRFGKSNFYIKK